MKNFKRVISGVIALALSASTLVAVSASKFADVDDNNNYAEAIEVLTALDVIHGYEEEGGLVFKPEGEITRAEAATMIVGALNLNDDAKAAAGTSKFTDVNDQASWASGYVNVGVAQGFINGMDETTFAPQQNVTYAQMCVMLSIITGYGDYAANYGGYPTGYMQMAASAGINKGVALSAETPLKRGQVAQMIYNALNAPILDIVEYSFTDNKYGAFDGKTHSLRTLLSEKHDACVLKGMVSDFPDAGTVRLVDIVSDYEKAPNSDDYFDAYATTAYNYLAINSNIVIGEGINLTPYYKQQIKGIMKVDENGKKHLVYAKPTSAVDTRELEATDFTSTYTTDKVVKFGTTRIKFATDTTKFPLQVYVNGYDYTTYVTPTDAQIEAILKNSVGPVKVAKVANTNGDYPTDYNAILVDAYQIAQVTKVSYKEGKTTVKLDNAGNSTNIGSYNTIEISDSDIENGAVKLEVTYDGKAIELKDLMENDIVAIKVQITPGATTINSSNKDITVLVSRETISGKVTSIDIDDANDFTIDSTAYAAVDKNALANGTDKLEVAKIYNSIYLDPFNRIFGYDTETVENVAKKYAILAKIDGADATIVLPNGSRKVIEMKDSSAVRGLDVHLEDGSSLNAGATLLGSVITYKEKNGQIYDVAVVPASDSIGIDNAGAAVQYKEAVSRLGSVGVNSATAIIDATESETGYSVNDYTKYKAISNADLIDGEYYIGKAYGKIGTSQMYTFVILTKAGYTYNENSRFAVVDATMWSTGFDADGDTVDQLKVLMNGEKTTLNFTTAAKAQYPAVTRGDAFFYTVDSDGLVDDIKLINLANIKNGSAFAGGAAAIFGAGKYDPSATKWGNTVGGTQDILLIAGVVVGKGSNSVRIAKALPTDGALFDADDYEAYSFAEGCAVYTLDENAEVASNKLDAQGSLSASNFKDWKVTRFDANTTALTANTDIGKVYWTNSAATLANLKAFGIVANDATTSNLVGEKTADEAQYAIAMVVDGQVVEIYEVVQD